MFKCECGKRLKNKRGLGGHLKSKEHLERIADLDDVPIRVVGTPFDEPLERFTTGAVRRKVKTISRTDLIPLEFLLALGERYHFGATVRGYGERNWEKGITYSNLLQHIQVHLSLLCDQIVARDITDDVNAPSGAAIDSPRANAAAIAWGTAAIIHFLAHGNLAEPKP